MANLPANRPAQTRAVSAEQMQDYLRRARADADSKFQIAFYSGEAKERLVQEHTVLYLSATKLEDGQFGPRWVLTLHENSPTEDGGLLTLPDNSWRTVYFQNLQILISKFGPIGPLQLSMKDTKRGQSYDLIEWSDEIGQVDEHGAPLPF